MVLPPLTLRQLRRRPDFPRRALAQVQQGTRGSAKLSHILRGEHRQKLRGFVPGSGQAASFTLDRIQLPKPIILNFCVVGRGGVKTDLRDLESHFTLDREFVDPIALLKCLGHILAVLQSLHKRRSMAIIMKQIESHVHGFLGHSIAERQLVLKYVLWTELGCSTRSISHEITRN